MKSSEITIGFDHTTSEMWHNATFVSTESAMQSQFEPPPPPNSRMERIRQELEKTIPRLARQEQDILEFMLKSAHGLATYDELAVAVWTPENYPSKSCVRQAVHRLRKRLLLLSTGYIVVGSHAGVYSFESTPIKIEPKRNKSLRKS